MNPVLAAFRAYICIFSVFRVEQAPQKALKSTALVNAPSQISSVDANNEQAVIFETDFVAFIPKQLWHNPFRVELFDRRQNHGGSGKIGAVNMNSDAL